MTYTQLAAAMRRVADAIDEAAKIHKNDPKHPSPAPMLHGAFGVGAAIFLCYLRDLLTLADKDVYTRSELLVLLETMSRDAAIFPAGAGALLWQAEDEDEG